MKQISNFFSFIILLIAVISILIFVIGVPEKSEIISADNIVVVSGLIRNSQNITIRKVDDYYYQIDPQEGVLEEPLLVSFDLSDIKLENDLALYWYDDEIQMWKNISEKINQVEKSISVERYRLGMFALRRYVDIQAPDFISERDELLQMAPTKAVGYRLVSGYILDDNFIVATNDSFEIGGCGGVVGKSNSTEISELKRTAHVLVDDVDTEVQFIFRALWFINDNGCINNSELIAQQM